MSRISAGILQNTPRVSTLFIFQSSQFLDALAQLAVPFAYKYEHFIVICVLYGLADGGFTTSLNSLLLSTVRPEQVSSGFGFGCLVSSVSIAAGAPLAGKDSCYVFAIVFLPCFHHVLAYPCKSKATEVWSHV